MVGQKIRDAVRVMQKKLWEAGIENAAFEAKQLLFYILQCDDKELLKNARLVTESEVSQLELLIARRAAGYPLQYLLGEWEFYGLPFRVGEGVLIPRQDTECLCEVSLNWLKGKQQQKIIDLCSGSGCIAIVLEHYSDPSNQVYALEKSAEAMAFLQQNRALNGSKVELLYRDVLAEIPEITEFDLVVSNPPYLNQEDMAQLQKEVTHEPEMALFAEQNGYLFYEEITRIWKDKIKSGGMLAYEVGIGQAEKTAEILSGHGFFEIEIHEDLCGVPRVVCGKKK